MRIVKMLPVLGLLMIVSSLAVAQTKTETFKVSGNCGMCKTKIEKAAKEAGAKEASWNADTKELTVTYKSSSTNTAKIQQKIADVGYDNAGFKATAESYAKLHGCCKYDREAVEKTSCCSEKCEMKDGKCSNMEKCKAEGCCKDEESCKANGCCGASHEKMDCCKDGKCSKEGHDGKDCCKKSDGTTAMNCNKGNAGCCSKKTQQ